MHTQNITNATIEARTHVEGLVISLDAIDKAITELGFHPADVTPISRVLAFSYDEPAALTDAHPAERRAAALAWLQVHARIIRRAAAILGADRVEKCNDYGRYGVRVWGTPGYYLSAEVPDNLTCEMVDTGETEVIPAQPEQIRPVFEKRCPESIFAGVQDEIEVMA